MEKEAHSSDARINISLVTPARGARSPPCPPLSPLPRSSRSRSGAKMGKNPWEKGAGKRGRRFLCHQVCAGGRQRRRFGVWGCLVGFCFFFSLSPSFPRCRAAVSDGSFARRNPPEAMEMQKSLGLGWGSRGRGCPGCLNSTHPPLSPSQPFPSLFLLSLSLFLYPRARDEPTGTPVAEHSLEMWGWGSLEVALGSPGCTSQTTGGKFLFC